MTPPSPCRLRPLYVSLLALGSILLLAALTGGLTGLDPEDNWGPARRQMLGVGLVIIGLGATPVLRQALAKAITPLREQLLLAATQNPISANLIRRVGRLGAGVRTVQGRLHACLRRSTVGQWISAKPGRGSLLMALAAFSLAVVVDTWLVSVGFWTDWPKTTHYYDMLADAFRHGQLHLLETPPPELLALPDPYDFAGRGSIPIPWDVVFYGGRYYLYWGPIPAILLAAWKCFSSPQVGDPVLVFTFALGTLLFLELFVIELWKRYFPQLSWVYLLLALLVASFLHPIVWLFNRPAIYEASIAAGQFFLLSGLYFVWKAMARQRISLSLLFLGGTCWACSVGSKASTLLAVGYWLVIVAAFVLLRPQPGSGPRQRALAIAALALPCVLGLAGLGWYNAQRFESPWEFGVRYQLTGKNLNREDAAAFSALNAPVNTYNYLFTPVRRLSVFPFIKPTWGSSSFPLLGWFTRHVPELDLRPPDLYYVEQVTGLLYAFPFAGLAIPAWFVASRRRPDKLTEHPGEKERTDGVPSSSFRLCVWTLSGAVVAASIPILVYPYATMRYMADFTPTLLLLSMLGAWGWLAIRREEGSSTWWLTGLIWVLALASVLASFLLAVTGYDMRFETLNPELFDRIVRFLAP